MSPTRPGEKPRAEADEASLSYPGWRVVFVCFVMAMVCWGFGFYGHAFYLAELHRIHNWPTGLISTAATVYYLSAAMLVIFISDGLRKFGARTCTLIGTAAFAASVAALPFLTAPGQVFAVYLVMALGWATMSVGAITNILGQWFQTKRGLAISLALNGASFSGVVVVPTMVLATAATNFTATMLASAALILLVMVPLAIKVLPERDVSFSFPLQDNPDAADRDTAWTRARALRSRSFWSISGPFSLSLLSQAGFLVHLIAFLEPNLGRGAAGLAMAVTTAMAIVGRLSLGMIADKTDQRLAATLSLVSQAVALAVMISSSSSTVLLLSCAVYGFSVGNLITFPALIIQREFPAASFGMIVGLSTAITQVIYSFGPGLVGIVRDASGSYTAALLICISLNLIAGAIVLRRPAAG
jgi:MFS family permease